MHDKEWLERVARGAKVFKESEFCSEPDEIDNFVSWLYHEYGIIETDKR